MSLSRYQTTRLGVYRSLMNRMEHSQSTAGIRVPLWKKATAGLSAGAVGAFVGTPAELAIIRMQSDSTLPRELRRGYRNVFDALIRVVREEGLTSMW